jgi:hypothetical protein
VPASMMPRPRPTVAWPKADPIWQYWAVAIAAPATPSLQPPSDLAAKSQTDYRHFRLERRDLKLLAFWIAMLTKRSAGNERTAGRPFDSIRIVGMGYG